MRLKDRVAIVTGGGGGIGEGICLCLAREGTHVVVGDVKAEPAEHVAEKVRETGRNAVAVGIDVSQPDQVQSLIDTTLSQLGGLDILVCCAGIGGHVHRGIDSEEPLTLENVRVEDWDLTLDVNLKGVFLCNRAAAPIFKKQKRGKIINISSVAGRKGVDWLVPYSVSKAGVIALTQAVALGLAPYNVNVNAVCPGIIYTPMWERGAAIMVKGHPMFAGKGLDPKQALDTIVRRTIPLKRYQTAEDIGHAVVFLASDEAKEITGQAVNVCGGMAMN
jgi:meso-butanediol dehydrogenase/(S,S)-butanediol dehydrogenase/diacetyl reductase